MARWPSEFLSGVDDEIAASGGKVTEPTFAQANDGGCAHQVIDL